MERFAGVAGVEPSSRVALEQFRYQKYCAISIAPGSTGDAMSHCLNNNPAVARDRSDGNAIHGAETFVNRSSRPKNFENVQFAEPSRYAHRAGPSSSPPKLRARRARQQNSRRPSIAPIFRAMKSSTSFVELSDRRRAERALGFTITSRNPFATGNVQAPRSPDNLYSVYGQREMIQAAADILVRSHLAVFFYQQSSHCQSHNNGLFVRRLWRHHRANVAST